MRIGCWVLPCVGENKFWEILKYMYLLEKKACCHQLICSYKDINFNASSFNQHTHNMFYANQLMIQNLSLCL